MYFVVVERASRRREGRVGPKNEKCPTSGSQDQIIPAITSDFWRPAALWGTMQLWETIL